MTHDRPRALVLLPLPIDVRLFTETLVVAERAWRQAGRHRKPMTTAHMREECLGGLRVLALYDAPVTGQLPPEVLPMVSPSDPAGQQGVLEELLDGPA